MRTSHIRALSVAGALAVAVTGCASERHAPNGSLASADLGRGWTYLADNRHPAFDVECDSIAFDRDSPRHVVPASAVETSYTPVSDPEDRGTTDLTEYVMQFESAAQASQALHTHASVATECAVGGDLSSGDDEHVVRATSHSVLSERTVGVTVKSPGVTDSFTTPYWLEFDTFGDRAIWLLVNGGTEQDVARLAARAAERAAGRR